MYQITKDGKGNQRRMTHQEAIAIILAIIRRVCSRAMGIRKGFYGEGIISDLIRGMREKQRRD